jgi:hypothetical protein
LKSITCVELELEAADEIRIANFLQILRSKQKINEVHAVVTSAFWQDVACGPTV